MILFYLSPFLTSFATSLSIELTVQPKLTQVPQVDSMTQVINTREVWVNEPLCYMVTSEGEVVNLEGLCDSSPDRNPRPRAASRRNIPYTPSTLTPRVTSSVIGIVPMARDNLRNNRDPEIEGYR